MGIAAAVALGVSYLCLLAAEFVRTVSAVQWNSDAASPLVLSGLVGHAGGPIVLGKISYASTLWFDVLTRGLPGHVRLWEVAPVVCALSEAALVVWSVARVRSCGAALLAVVTLTAVAPDVLYTCVAQAFHGTTWFAAAMLGAFLLISAHAGARTGIAVAVGIVAGVCLVSDPLLLVAGLLPAAIAPLLLARLGEPALRRTALHASLAVAVAAVVAAAVDLWQRAEGISTAPTASGGGIGIASPRAVVSHAAMLLDDLTALAGGASLPLGVRAMLDILLVLALAGVARGVVRALRAGGMAPPLGCTSSTGRSSAS